MTRYGDSRPNSKSNVLKQIEVEEERLVKVTERINSGDNRSLVHRDLHYTEKRIRRLKSRLSKGDYTVRPIKTHKCMTLDKLEGIILERIEQIKKSNHPFKVITKEEIVRDYKVKEGFVEQVFHRLNLQGILSQRHAYYAHDTNRNPMFPMPESGWGNDYYKILNIEEE